MGYLRFGDRFGEGGFGPGADKWFFISSDFAFGHALERDAIAAVEKLGGTVVGHVRAPFGTADFSSFLLQAQQSKASVVAFRTGGADTVNILKQAAEFNLAKPGVRVMPLQLMIDEVKAIGLELGQGNFSLMAFHHERSPEAKTWSLRFFDRVKAMPTAIQAGTYSAVRHYLQAVKDSGTDEPLAVVAKMRATPVNDMFTIGGYLREDGRMVHDMYLTQIKTPAESTGPWDLVKIVKTIRGEDAFRPLAESECPWSSQRNDGDGRSRAAEQLSQMIRGSWISQIVGTLAQLEIADRLAPVRRNPAPLPKETGATRTPRFDCSAPL